MGAEFALALGTVPSNLQPSTVVPAIHVCMECGLSIRGTTKIAHLDLRGSM
jgi:hypothetical protein